MEDALSILFITFNNCESRNLSVFLFPISLTLTLIIVTQLHYSLTII